MKRFILSIVALAITSVCFAQDIIVQKDGNTIPAKVIKVTQSEVEYKKFNNQDGPTYTISIKDLLCINYENGATDTFGSANLNPNNVPVASTNSRPTDSQLLDLYSSKSSSSKLKKAKIQRIIGYVGGGLLVAGGLVLGLAIDEIDVVVAGDHYHQVIGNSSNTPAVAFGVSMAAVGLIGGTCLVLNANHKIKQINRLSVMSIPFMDVQLSNKHVTANVDLIKDNYSKSRTLGLGLSYNF